MLFSSSSTIGSTQTLLAPIIPCAGAALTGLQGTTVGGFSGQGEGPDTLDAPVNVALTAALVYIVDTDNHRVMMYTPPALTGVIVAGNGNAGVEPAAINTPYDAVILSANSHILVCEKNNSIISEWINDAYVQTVFGQSGNSGNTIALLNNPQGLYLKDPDQLYILDSGNSRVLLFDLTTNVTTELITSGVSPEPTDLYVDATNNIYLGDGHQIKMWSAPTLYSAYTVVGIGLTDIKGICGDQISGFYYVVDGSANCVKRFVVDGPESYGTLLAGQCGSAGAKTDFTLNNPTGCAVTADGGLLNVADTDGEASEWYLSNMDDLDTWSKFCTEIAKTYSSPAAKQLAAQQLQSRRQGLQESVMHY
ncbi:unnamed protein product, partial [Didymodactylos carnosus]